MPVVVRVLLQIEEDTPIQVGEMMLSRPEQQDADTAAMLRVLADEIENPTTP
jgi:hypothetical protein